MEDLLKKLLTSVETLSSQQKALAEKVHFRLWYW